MDNKRVYNIVLFPSNGKKETHILLGHENGKKWNILGGKQDPEDETYYVTAAKRLYEISGKYFDKRDNTRVCYDKYWLRLSRFIDTHHTVFIHDDLHCDISKLNEAVSKYRVDSSVKVINDYKSFRLVKLEDLINLAETQIEADEDMVLKSPEGDLIIDSWLLFYLSHIDLEIMCDYI